MKSLQNLSAGVLAIYVYLAGLAMGNPPANPVTPAIAVDHHAPCNIFLTDEPVHLKATLRAFPAGDATLSISVRDYFGRVMDESKPLVQVGETGEAALPIDLGKLPCGYYELTVAAASDSKSPSTTIGFGVTKPVVRTAAEAREGNYRFGLKIFQGGDIWWKPGVIWNVSEAVDACAKLGLQWTRHAFNQEQSDQPGVISTVDLIKKHPMNVVLKIEGIPETAYDADRYGPLADFAKNNKKKSWRRCTVPKKEPYQAWLRQEIAKLPPEQNVFEIGNEVWNYMSAEEFAEWTQMVVPVVREMRQNAVIGADPGKISWAKKFIAAGGMNGLDMQAIHPYSFNPLPERRIRAWLRNRADFLKQLLGRDLDIYVTEYGWQTAPQDKRKEAVSDRTQAQRTTRESLMLYAEDCKTIIPHWMADREQDPTDRESWFGFFRLNGQPKAVVMAHANCARMIDGSRFVGDLPVADGIGAMLFEHKGVYTLALWTLDEALGDGKDVAIESRTGPITRVDLMGGEQTVAPASGKIAIRVSGDVTYLVGVDPELAKKVISPANDLDTQVWTPRGGTDELARAPKPLQMDGVLDDWASVKAIPLTADGKGLSVSDHDGSKVYLSWDENALYVAVSAENRVDVTSDLFDLRLSTRPSRQLSFDNWAIYDYALNITPPKADKAAQLTLSNCVFDQPMTTGPSQSVAGIKFSYKQTANGWTAELVISKSLLKGFPEKPSMQMSYVAQLTGTSLGREKSRLASSPVDAADSLRWPLLVLQP